MATSSPALRLSQTALRALRPRPFPHPPPSLSTTSPLSLLSRNNSNHNSSSHNHVQTRRMHATPPAPRRKPLAHNKEEVPDTAPPTDFSQLDMLASAPVPTTSVDICHADGFSLNSGVEISGGDGALLVGGEAFVWRPWLANTTGGKGKRGGLVNDKGMWEVGEEGFAVLGAVWPRPDLLILGLGPEIRPLSPATRRAISNLGMRIEVLDTRNAASQYNLLATERGVDDVAAALIPIGWKEGSD